MRKRDRLIRFIKQAAKRGDRNTPPEKSPPDQSADMLKNKAEPVGGTQTEAQPSNEPAAVVADEQEDNAPNEQEQKIAKHFEKTRVAMLKFLHENGKTAHLKEMHDLSERRYFIAHRRFSDLMESLVDHGLIEFRQETNEATITTAGIEYIQE